MITATRRIGGAAMVAVIAGAMMLAARAASADTSAPPVRVALPQLACDSCSGPPPQHILLSYIGFRADSLLADSRVRAGIWAALDPWALPSELFSAKGNAGVALSPVTPDRPQSYIKHQRDLGLCGTLLNAAGLPASGGRRFTLAVDVPTDGFASNLLGPLATQLGGCDIALAFVPHSPAEYSAMLREGRSAAFLASIDADAAQPYQLLERLFARDSPDNFTDVDRRFAGSLIQPLLAQARGTVDPDRKAAIYQQVNEAVMDGSRAAQYMSVLPLAWVYDAIGGPQPPLLSLFPPQATGLAVSINGVTLPGDQGRLVAAIHWDWGDGVSEDHWFPADHRYASADARTVVVTAYQDNGYWTARAIIVRVPP